MTYTPKQLAEMLRIAPSTLRKYSAAFRTHLSPSAQRKQRTYTDEDVSTLKRIVELRANGVPLGEIDQRLLVQVEGSPGADNLAMIPQVAARFEDLYRQIAAQAQQLEELQARLDELERRSLWQRLFPPRKPRDEAIKPHG
jgi:DNA-binding transcriptional MerR regulator